MQLQKVFKKYIYITYIVIVRFIFHNVFYSNFYILFNDNFGYIISNHRTTSDKFLAYPLEYKSCTRIVLIDISNITLG